MGIKTLNQAPERLDLPLLVDENNVPPLPLPFSLTKSPRLLNDVDIHPHFSFLLELPRFPAFRVEAVPGLIQLCDTWLVAQNTG